ncbi:hypothetical protein [Methanotorris igneus]|uniref:DUF4276 family protein n=1 Tax=Methanotorris igneus (strain DSM 5666 / JCM 11834 / Kol 5) TaxID=880724 RepID=F6BAJ2_METIK|nr:hypothetical protein [Methanotorris igneus]AEF97005.1 hypothetical protein Metig_1471 [Methanotorris igneus Kol 5]
MTYKLLYVFVEGNDDERFFERVIKPLLEKKYDHVQIIKYAEEKDEKIINWIKSIESMDWADYIYVADINNSPCITRRKEKIKQRYKNVDNNKIIIVIKKIESWYIAGISPELAKKLKIKLTHNIDANTITKEQFNNLIPKNDSRINFMIEILKHYSIEIARKKNKSFDYFMRKFIDAY